MANSYYTRNYDFAAGTKAKGEHVRNELDALSAGFDKLPVPEDVLTPTTVQPYVDEAQNWASYAEDQTVPDGGGLYSSYHYSRKSDASAQQAAQSASDASGSESAAAQSATDAADSASASAGYATEPYGQYVSGTTDYSAYHHSVVASQYATYAEDTQIPGTTDYSARHWALYAEEQAATIDAAIVWGGPWDVAVNGTPPTPDQPTRYIATSDGTVDGETVVTNDTILYDTVAAEWLVIPGNGQVASVNGKVGALTLDYGDFAGGQNAVLNNNLGLRGRLQGGGDASVAKIDANDAVALGDSSVQTRVHSSGAPVWNNGTEDTEMLHAGGGQAVNGDLGATSFTENGTALSTKYAEAGHNHDTTYLGINAKAADSDKLDGINSSGFLRSDTSDTKTGGHTRYNDNIELYFGNGDDGKFFSSGTHLYCDLRTDAHFYIREGSTTRFEFHDTGLFRADNDVVAYYSDERLKNIVGRPQGCLDDVMQWRVIEYYPTAYLELESGGSFDSRVKDLSLSAQSVEQNTPEAVTAAPFDLDDDGNSKSGENYLTLKDRPMIAKLAGAVQELAQRVMELEKQLEARHAQ